MCYLSGPFIDRLVDLLVDGTVEAREGTSEVARIQVEDSTSSEAKGRQMMISSPGTQVSSSPRDLDSELTENEFRSIVFRLFLPNSSSPSSTSVMTPNNLSENLYLRHSFRISVATSIVRSNFILPLPSPSYSKVS